MPESARRIVPQDLLPLADYERRRTALRADLIPMKKQRRIDVGPFATQAEASQLCSGLKSAGGSCLVQRN